MLSDVYTMVTKAMPRLPSQYHSYHDYIMVSITIIFSIIMVILYHGHQIYTTIITAIPLFSLYPVSNESEIFEVTYAFIILLSRDFAR